MHVYFKSITLENVRCFGKKQTIDFTDKDGKPSMWNLILGDNGTGKTTVLRVLTAHYLYILQSKFSPYSFGVTNEYFVREKILQAKATIKQQDWVGGRQTDGTMQMTFHTDGMVSGGGGVQEKIS
ncbi:MAG TPA: ATP-binding protein, partial [Saprospiraceae bacterium]|nr:ATP-binding protein [Saprospiraceae bacterium]